MNTIGSAGSGYGTLYAATQATDSRKAGRSDEQDPLKQLFGALDSDGDGSLSASELSAALSSSGGGASTEIDIDGLLNLLDQDGGGTVSESELAQAFAPPPPRTGGADMPSLPSGLNSEGDDALGVDALDVAGDSDQASQLLVLLDTDEDGTLSLQELQEGLQPQDPPPSSGMPEAGDGSQALEALVQMAMGRYRETASATSTPASQLHIAA